MARNPALSAGTGLVSSAGPEVAPHATMQYAGEAKAGPTRRV